MRTSRSALRAEDISAALVETSISIAAGARGPIARSGGTGRFAISSSKRSTLWQSARGAVGRKAGSRAQLTGTLVRAGHSKLVEAPPQPEMQPIPVDEARYTDDVFPR